MTETPNKVSDYDILVRYEMQVNEQKRAIIHLVEAGKDTAAQALLSRLNLTNTTKES